MKVSMKGGVPRAVPGGGSPLSGPGLGRLPLHSAAQVRVKAAGHENLHGHGINKWIRYKGHNLHMMICRKMNFEIISKRDKQEKKKRKRRFFLITL